MLVQCVVDSERRKGGERGAEGHVEEREALLDLAFFQVAQHADQSLSIDQFLPLRIEGDGDRCRQAFAKLREFGLIGAVASGAAGERDLMTDEPVLERRELSFKRERIVEVQMLGVQGTQEVRFVQRRKQFGLPSPVRPRPRRSRSEILGPTGGRAFRRFRFRPGIDGTCRGSRCRRAGWCRQ